jgi:tetratricopeptide (TPR) repeat protein
MRLYNSQDYEGAVAAFTEAIGVDPNDVAAYRLRADAYRRLGREEEAEVDSRKIAELSQGQAAPQSGVRRAVGPTPSLTPRTHSTGGQTQRTRGNQPPQTSSIGSDYGGGLEDFFTFRHMITPVLIQIVYWISTVAVVIIGLWRLFDGDSGMDRFMGFLIIVVGALTIRIYAELLMVVFRMNDTLTDIRNNTRQR